MIDNDEPTPYHGVAEMVARSKCVLLDPWELKHVSAEHPTERAWRATEADGHDPKAFASFRSFLNEEHVWQEAFAEIDWRDPNMRKPGSGAKVVAAEPWPVIEGEFEPWDDDEPSAGDVAEAVEMARG